MRRLANGIASWFMLGNCLIGPTGYEQVHYEAPPGAEVSGEVNAFLKWYNETTPSVNSDPDIPGLVRAAPYPMYWRYPAGIPDFWKEYLHQNLCSVRRQSIQNPFRTTRPLSHQPVIVIPARKERKETPIPH